MGILAEAGYMSRDELTVSPFLPSFELGGDVSAPAESLAGKWAEIVFVISITTLRIVGR